MRPIVFMALVLSACATARTTSRTASFAMPPSTAIDIGGGVSRQVLRNGTGNIHPDAGSIVRVEFAGFRSDGSEFDSSRSKGKPQVYELSKVVRGLSRAIEHMVVGESSRFWIPADLAYGESPEDARLPAGDLVFDIELLNIVRH